MSLANKLPKLSQNANLSGKRVLVRVDFNVPFEKGKIVDDFRIVKTLPVLRRLLKPKARIIFLSHLTEKKGRRSFKPMLPGLSEYLHAKVRLARTVAEARSFEKESGTFFVLLENLRAFPEEEKGAVSFARDLASLGDVFVNEDFSQSHRPYASIMHLPRLLPSFAGPLMVEEVEKLEESLDPPHPFALILGGMKFSTKVGVLARFMKKADLVFVGGALANTFLYAGGQSVGKSKVEQDEAERIKRTFLKNPKLLLPCDIVVQRKRQKYRTDISPGDVIYDAGPRTIREIESRLRDAKMILWNGPLGFTEKGFEKGTEDLARILSRSKAKVIVGGGDTLAAIHRFRLEKKFYHLSTGGGAMLEFLAKGTLPGIDALLRSRK